jgi:hypothetical protein
VLAVDVIASLLIVGVVLLCATTAVAALSVPGFDWPHRRRPVADDPPTNLDELVGFQTPAVSRRVVTGNWIEGHPSARDEPPPGAIEMRAISTGQDADKADGRRVGDNDVAAAEAFITELLDTNPRRLADLMLQWIAADGERTDRDDRT